MNAHELMHTCLLIAGLMLAVGRGAANTGTAAAQVHGFAHSLANQGNQLKLEVGKFLTTIRAA